MEALITLFSDMLLVGVGGALAKLPDLIIKVSKFTKDLF